MFFLLLISELWTLKLMIMVKSFFTIARFCFLFWLQKVEYL